MDEEKFSDTAFEANRSYLRGVAYRMLGSQSEADDAVQETWLRLHRADTEDVENMRAWLTTVIGRVCLNMLRSRSTRQADSLDGHLPDPIVTRDDGADPAAEALLADSVGLALLIVLETLSPPERLAFVMHDIFAVPFDEIAPMVDRSPDATRQLASRARRRVQGAAVPDTNLVEQRRVVNAFFAAAHAGNFDALVAVLDPDAVARTDGGPTATFTTRGAEAIARQALTYARPSSTLRPALVNGIAGVVVLVDDLPVAVMGFTVRGGAIVAIDSLADEERLRALDLSSL